MSGTWCSRSDRNNVSCRIITVFIVVLVMAGAAIAQNTLEDRVISDAVDDRLADDPAVPARNIDVSTADGILSLTGSVPNILAAERAGRVAAAVKGVLGVVNRIEITAPARPDEELRLAVAGTLRQDPVTETGDISVSVSRGVVTLNGTVESWQEKQLAARLAKGVYGVRELVNQLAINYRAERTDTEIREEIVAVLRWDVYVDDVLIGVTVTDGKVILDGIVGSMAEKNKAGNRAWVAGVASVENNLEVDWKTGAEQMRREKYVVRSDAEIESAVRDALQYDPRVKHFNIRIESEGGYVSLRGIVDNLRAKRAAAGDAVGVAGVWGVRNRIKVRADEPADAVIRERVVAAFKEDPYVNRHEIEVAVTDGLVNLFGDVDSIHEKKSANEAAARQRGVVDVRNHLTVNNPFIRRYNPYVDEAPAYDYLWYDVDERIAVKSDWQIKKEIEDQFFWSPFVDGDQVEVRVDGGIAVLRGTVDTWAERQAAADNAFQGGALAVDNNLKVRYGPEEYIR